MEKQKIDQEHRVDVDENPRVFPTNSDEWCRSIMNDEDELQLGQGQAIPKIPRVPQKLWAVESNRHCFVPLVVSIGPYHHGKQELNSMEQLKKRLAKQFVHKMGKPFLELYKRVENLAAEARKCYTEDSMKKIDDMRFAQMMFLDACFFLRFVHCVLSNKTSDLKMKSHEIASVQRDMLLLENQLPCQILYSLGKEIDPRNSFPDELDLIAIFVEIVSPLAPIYPMLQSSSNEARSDPTRPSPVILLDYFLGEPNSMKNLIVDVRRAFYWHVFHRYVRHWHVRRSTKELSFAGISFKPSKKADFTDIKFRSGLLSGVLTLPSLVIDNTTKSKILNLVAYEMCSNIVSKNGVTSYICFLGSLISHADDVKLLRSSGVLFNFLNNDEEAAKLIDEIACELVPDQDDRIYLSVNREIEAYFKDRRKTKVATWVAEVIRDHFRSPWTAIIVFATIFTISLSFIQTYFTVFPAPDKCQQSICNYIKNTATNRNG